MTWEELAKKAKELEYFERNGLMHPTKGMLFFKNGVVNIGEEVFTNISYDKMWQIMEALN